MSITAKLLELSNCDFIQEIKSILSTKPVEQWCINIRTNSEGQHCAFGWIDRIDPECKVNHGFEESPLGERVGEIIGEVGWPLARANNGTTYQGIDNPKDRSLAYLEDWLKANCS